MCSFLLPRLRSVKMEQRKLSDQANTLVDLSKASPTGTLWLGQTECFSSLGKTKADLADRKMLQLNKCQQGIAAVGWLPLQSRRRNTYVSQRFPATLFARGTTAQQHRASRVSLLWWPGMS